MAISEAYTNTATISTTEYSLTNNSTTVAAQTTAGAYQVFIDFNAMTATETYEIKIKEKVISTGTQRDITTARLSGAQPGPYVTPTMILLNGWDVTVKKIAGTDRSILWSIRKVA